MKAAAVKSGNSRTSNPGAETMGDHAPLKEGEKAQQECWANFSGGFMTQGGPAFLQPGQFIPIWQKKAAWRLTTPFQLTIMSAFVVNSRFMVRGGNSKLSSHPKIVDWMDDVPMKGQGGELRFPGGIRRLRPSGLPVLQANGKEFEKRNITAKVFVDHFSEATLHSGCPIEIVVRADAVEDELPYPQHAMYDVVRQETVAGYAIPLPMILSDEEEIVLKDYPENWTEAVKAFCSVFGIGEVGVLYKAGEHDIVTDISNERPKQLYRNVMGEGDLGIPTLDYELYERMLPFNGAKLDPEFLPT